MNRGISKEKPRRKGGAFILKRIGCLIVLGQRVGSPVVWAGCLSVPTTAHAGISFRGVVVPSAAHGSIRSSNIVVQTRDQATVTTIGMLGSHHQHIHRLKYSGWFLVVSTKQLEKVRRFKKLVVYE